MSETHSRQTIDRYANFNIIHPVVKRQTEGGRTFIATACQAWNKLLFSMRKMGSLNAFRNSLSKRIFKDQQLLNHLLRNLVLLREEEHNPIQKSMTQYRRP